MWMQVGRLKGVSQNGSEMATADSAASLEELYFAGIVGSFDKLIV